MEVITKTLFWVANSLLIPDIILLLLLFVRGLVLAGGFYNQFITKRKNDRLLTGKIQKLDLQSVEELRDTLPSQPNSLFTKYLKDLLLHPENEDYGEYLISNFELEAEKDLSVSRLLAKMGPVLGLIGTLIAMSPALVGLSTGDIAGMAYNMQVVFATTVVGLVVSAIGLVTLQYKQRWYSEDVNNLDYVARIFYQKNEIA